MRNRKKRNKIMLLLVLLLAISIGFAALATTLKINGTTNIGKNEWNIYWNRIANQSGVTPESGPTIGNDSLGGVNTQVTFTVDLDTPGDFYEFTVDAVNAGTLDAMIESHGFTLNGNPITAQNKLPDYVKFTVVYADDGTEIQDKHLLPKATKEGGETTPTRETYKVRVEFDRDIVEIDDLDEIDDEGDSYEIGFSVKYVQADNTAIDRHFSAITYITRQVEGQITPGDVIGIGSTEDFYVVSSNSTTTVLLAKYNLLVGNWESETLSPSTTPGYGLQSIEAIGYAGDMAGHGTDVFSITNYWDDGYGNIIDPYDSNGASYSGNPYPYVYDSNSTIYQYISGQSGYVSKLIAMGAPDTITGRLLSYEEADTAKEIGRVDIDQEYYTSIIFNGQEYWLGSAIGNMSVGIVAGSVGDGYYYDLEEYFGVRPVIEINTSDIPE